MNLNLTNKNVLITGASSGIGFAIAESFLKEEAKVCIVSRGSSALYKSEEKLQKTYGLKSAIAFKCDCTKVQSLTELRKKVDKKLKSLDIVVVNVGDGRSVADALPSDENWKDVWNSNFESALQTARTFLPMLKKSSGCLLFISSITGLEAFGAPTDYSTAKAAVIALSKNMARKLALSVRVNVILPGNVYFEGGSWYEKMQKDKKLVKKLIKSTVPMNRFATPNEIADSAVFLCSEKASFITGASLIIDGGQTVGMS